MEGGNLITFIGRDGTEHDREQRLLNTKREVTEGGKSRKKEIDRDRREWTEKEE